MNSTQRGSTGLRPRARGRARRLLLVLLVAALTLPATAEWALAGAYQSYGGGGAEAWYLRARSTGYAYRVGDPAGRPEQDRFEFFQGFDGSYTGLASGKLDFRFSTRFGDDLAIDAPDWERERLYTAYFQYHLPRRGRARLGRMFLQEGTANYTMDGLYLSLRPTGRSEVRVWGGARTPYRLNYEIGDPDEQGTAGARVLLAVARWARLGLSWTYLDNEGYTQYQRVGGEAQLHPLPGLRALVRGHYDTTTEEWDKGELMAWYHARPGVPAFSLQYLDRRPAVEAGTYWERFAPALERVQLLKASARWENEKRIGGEIEYFGGFTEDFEQTRLGLAFLFPYGRLGYSFRLGNGGEESRLYGDLRYEPLSWLDLQGGATFASYALLEDAPSDLERDIVTLYARALAELRAGLDLHLEIQSLSNELYEEDVRFLVGLDLAVGGGASPFGLGTGGWLQ